MTDREIRLELAKAALMSTREMDFSLQEIYEWVMMGGDGKKETDTPKMDYRDKPIGEVLTQIVNNSYYDHKYVVRLERVFKKSDIRTVGDLLKYGRSNFSKLLNVGRGSLTRIDDALEELYGLKSWY